MFLRYLEKKLLEILQDARILKYLFLYFSAGSFFLLPKVGSWNPHRVVLISFSRYYCMNIQEFNEDFPNQLLEGERRSQHKNTEIFQDTNIPKYLFLYFSAGSFFLLPKVGSWNPHRVPEYSCSNNEKMRLEPMFYTLHTVYKHILEQ